MRRSQIALLTLDTFGNGEEDAGNEGFAVVGLLEGGDLFTKTRAVKMSDTWTLTLN